MQLRYFQADDPFAAASARSESAYSAACLPTVPLPADPCDADALSSCAAAANGLARELLDAVAPQPAEEVAMESRPQAAFQGAMLKARQLLRPKLNAVGRLLRGSWWLAAGAERGLGVALPAAADAAEDVAPFEAPVLQAIEATAPEGGRAFRDIAHGVGAARANAAHSGDNTAAAALRNALGVHPRHVAPPQEARPAASAALLLPYAEHAACADESAPQPSPELLAVMPPPEAFATSSDAPPALALELLSGAAAALAPAEVPPDSPRRVERDAANADAHTRACALLRALSAGVDAPLEPHAADVAALAAALLPPAGGADDAGMMMAVDDGASAAADVAAAADVFTLEVCAVNAGPDVPTGGAAVSANAACLSKAALDADTATLPPPLGAAARAAATAGDTARGIQAALLHTLVLAPALTAAAHVPALAVPFVREDPPAPSATSLLPPAAVPLAPVPIAVAELRLPWGEDAHTLCSPGPLRRRMARPEPRATTPAEEAQLPAAPELRSVMELMDAEEAVAEEKAEVCKMDDDDKAEPAAEPAAKPAAAAKPPVVTVPEAPMRLVLRRGARPPTAPAAPPAAAALMARDASLRGGGGGLGAALTRGTTMEADLQRFLRQRQQQSGSEGAGGGAKAAAAVTPAALPPPQEHVVELPAEPHASTWRALRRAAAAVTAREVARHNARDAAALLDGLNSDAASAAHGGPDLRALQARIRALAASGAADSGHVRSLACCYALCAAAGVLAQCGLRVAHAYLEAALRGAPGMADGALRGAAAAPRAALAAAVAALDAAPPSAPLTDHPKLRVLRHVLATADAFTPGSKTAVVADARAACTLAAAVAALGLRPHQMDREGVLAAAFLSGDAAALEAALRAAVTACDVLLLTHSQLAAAAPAATGLSAVFARVVLYTQPPPGEDDVPAALLLTPGRAYTGEVHVCTVRLPAAPLSSSAFPIDDEDASLPTTAAAAAPHPQPQPPAVTAAPHSHPVPPQRARQPPPSWADADAEDSGFASLLVAMGARSGVLRSWPALRDALLRLEGRHGASVAERELGAASGLDECAEDAAARLLRRPDALALGVDGGVAALRVLRGDTDAALLAAAAAPGGGPRLAAELAALAVRVGSLALVVVCGADSSSNGGGARAAAPAAAALAGAAAAACLRLNVTLATSDAAGRNAAIEALTAAAPPSADAPQRLRALPDAPPPGEALLCACSGLSPLTAHALLCSGVPIAALLRADITNTMDVAAAAARGGAFLSAATLAAFDAFRSARIAAVVPMHAEMPQAQAAWAPPYESMPLPPQQQAWQAPVAQGREEAQAAAARAAWASAPAAPGGWREAHAAAAAGQWAPAPPPQYMQQHPMMPPPQYAPPCMQQAADEPQRSFDDDEFLFEDEPPPPVAWPPPRAAMSAAYLAQQQQQPSARPPQGARSAAMGAAALRAAAPGGMGVGVGAASHGGDGIDGLLDSWLRKRGQGDARGTAPAEMPARSAASSSDSDDLRGFLSGLECDDDAMAGGGMAAAPRWPPPAAQHPAQQPQARMPPPPRWQPQPAASGSGAVAAPRPAGSAAPTPRRLDAFRLAQERPPQAQFGDDADDDLLFAGRGGATKRLRFVAAPASSGAPPPPPPQLRAPPSPAGSSAFGSAAFGLGGVRFAPGVQAAVPRAAPAGSALLPPPSPSPAGLPRGALTATPDAKKKLSALLEKMGARRGGGSGRR